jgi:hypothetical protein
MIFSKTVSVTAEEGRELCKIGQIPIVDRHGDVSEKDSGSILGVSAEMPVYWAFVA